MKTLNFVANITITVPVPDGITPLEYYESMQHDQLENLAKKHGIHIYEICDFEWSDVNEKEFPFKEGDTYFTIEDGQIIESCWDDVSEELYSPSKAYYPTREDANMDINTVTAP